MQVDELARVVTNLCAIVPGGIVCFFPSYDYENMVCIKWENTGVMEKIRKKKQVIVCVCVHVYVYMCMNTLAYITDRYFENHVLLEQWMMY